MQHLTDLFAENLPPNAERDFAVELKRRSLVFDTVLSSITDFLYVFDRAGRFVYANQPLLDLLDVEADEIVGKNFFDLDYPKDLAERLQRQIQEVFETKEKLADETRFDAPNGETGHYEYIFSPVLSENGSVELVAGLTRDVTQRRRTELNLAFLAGMQKDFARFLSADEIMRAAGGRIAEHLNLSHCLFVEVDETADTVNVFFDCHAADVPSLVGVYRLGDFQTAEERQRLAAGKVVVTDDVRDAPRSAEAAAEFEALGIRSLINAPYLSDGRWKFTLAAQHQHPHQWREDEIELLKDLSARIYLRLERARAEETLRESETKYRTLFDSIDVGFCVIEVIFDEDGEAFDYLFLEANPAFEKQTGIVNAIGKRILDIAPTHEKFWFETYGRIALTGEPAGFEHRAAALDRWYDVYAFRIGKPESRQVAVLFTDISRRKQAETDFAFLAEISQDLAQLPSVSEIMETVGAKIGAFLQLSVCNFIKINETGDKATIDYSWHTADASNFSGVVNITEFISEEFRQASSDGQLMIVSDTQTDARVRAENYAARQIGSFLSVPFVRDGRWRFLLVAYHSAAHDWQPREVELLNELTVRVWTRLERARADELIRESREKLQTALEAGKMGSWQLDLTDGAMAASDVCKKNYGRRPDEEFTYQNLADSVHPDDRERWRETVDEAINKCADFEIEYRVRWRDDSLHWVLVRGNCFKDQAGKTNLLAGVSIDITDRRRIEEERQILLESEQEMRRTAENANRLKDEFLATLSHELRTPLNAILGWSQMLQTKKLGETDAKKALSTIERSARSQNQLIDDLLDVSRIINGKLRLDVRSVDLSTVITAAIDAARPAAEAKNIRLQTLLDPQAGPISGDPDRLQQVVWNLLSNAVKFTPKDGRIQVRLERVNSHVEIVVSDTGKGIEAEFLPHVFDRFRQSDGSMTRRHGGLGLGLAIVRQLVELHGGTVSVTSAGEEAGSTFTVHLPLLPVRREPSSDVPRVHPAARKGAVLLDCPPELDGLRVLLVDDEADSRELLNLVLDSCGAQVTTAASVAAALEKLQRGKFDVIVSDIGMPEEDGFSLIGKIRQLSDAEGGSTPAIALTAYARAQDRVQALRAGFQMHIAKPVEPDELVVAVANLAGRMRNTPTGLKN